MNALIPLTTIFYVSPEQICQVLQAHSEGGSLQGISRTSGLTKYTASPTRIAGVVLGVSLVAYVKK